MYGDDLNSSARIGGFWPSITQLTWPSTRTAHMAQYTYSSHGPVHVQLTWPSTRTAHIAQYTYSSHGPVHVQLTWPSTRTAHMAQYTYSSHGPVHVQLTWPSTRTAHIAEYTYSSHGPVHIHLTWPSTRTAHIAQLLPFARISSLLTVKILVEVNNMLLTISLYLCINILSNPIVYNSKFKNFQAETGP